MDGLPLAVLGQVGPWGLVAGFVLLVMTGRLIPRAAHQDRITDLKAAITALEATVAERERQIGVLMGRAKEPAS